MSPFIGQQDDDNVATRTRVKPKVEKPKLYKVLLLNDDYTPRDFVVQILKAEFRVTDDEAYNIMITAHQKGLCVVAVYTKDVAETKAARATDMAKEFGFPLMFETEPEE
ncbi:MAG: ATP-dependent Clp protease adapter ClpS [Pseudomonadota bacterium]